MAVFHYVSVNAQGQTFRGVLEGDSSRQIKKYLQEKGLTPLEIKEEKESAAKWGLFKRASRLSNTDLSMITYQLGILLSAGLQIETALQNITEQIDKKEIKSILLSVREKVLEGYMLADAMGNYPQIFPDLYRNTILAGEKSGHLEKVVTNLAVYLEQQETIRSKIKTAMIYPALLTLVSIGIIAFLLTYAMPKITGIFIQNGQALPGITMSLLALSKGLKAYGIYILLFIMLCIYLFRSALRNYNFRYGFHKFLLKIPVINKTITIVNASRFARTFGILFAATVPTLEAMRTANNTVTLLPMNEAIEKAIVQVGEGASIHKALFATGYFTKLSTQLIASGEASGKLEMMLEKAANYQEQNMLKWTSTALALFEPVIILLMGFFVLFIVLAIMMPILQMNEFFG